MASQYHPRMPAQLQQSAPHFSAIDQEGNPHRLEDFKGQWLLLYFYPKDDTPGCTKEACGFRDAFADLQQVVQVLGVSKDSRESHQRFAEKYQLPYSLLVDTDQAIIGAYGADGGAFPKRTSFLIDPAGKIAKIYEKIDCQAHAEEILQDVRTMKTEQ